MECHMCKEECNAYYMRRYGMCQECLDKLRRDEELE